MLDQLGIGSQIGHRGRNSIEARAKDTGKAEQRRLEIKRWQRGAEANKDINFFHAGQQPHQRGMALENDLAASLFHQGDITDELQKISQALLNVQENRAAVQVHAIPKRLLKPASMEFGPRPTPFVFRPTSL